VPEDESHDEKTQSFTALTSGTSVLHYKILEKIGSGGMGEVYLALDTKLNRKVALKFLPPHLCQDDDCRKRFTREAQAAAKLSHPNIIHVYEVSEYQGRPFFAMEHVEGRSLRDVKSEEFDVDRIIGIAIQLCDGLQKAHAAGVVHRDIKPSNIIIDSSGRPRLLDFGLATVKGGEHLTKTGSTLGTVGYMSPEQIEGKETDARSDLFSLGVVLYELTAKKSPFRRDDETATLKAILQDTPEPLARYKSGVPDDLQRIVSKLLEKDPSLRYQSAAGVIPDLKKLSATSTARVATERKRSRWNRYVVSSPIVLLSAVLAVWYFGYRDRAPSTAGNNDRIMLAVLPFDNLGDPEDEYFADGMTGEIISRLSCLSNLGVISRTSVYAYKDMQKTIPEIASELRVGYVLEGTIRWDRTVGGSRIRVTPELIEVATDAHLWSDRYDRTLTSTLEVQADIAAQVVEALGVTLGSSEQSELTRRPTDDINAYDAYMRALEFNIYFPEEARAAMALYEQAINLDSGFVDAYGRLAEVCIWLVRLGEDTDGTLLNKALASLEIAGKMEPENRNYLMAIAAYEYYVNLNYDKALATCRRVESRYPNDGLAFKISAAILRRQGKWDECLVDMQRAVRLNPRDILWEYGGTLRLMRLYDTAMAVFDRLLSLEPGHEFAVQSKALLLIAWKGDLLGARRIIEEAQQKYGISPGYAYILADIDVYLGDYDRALNRLAAPVLGHQQNLDDFYLQKALVLEYAGKKQLSRVHYDSALTYLEANAVQGSPMAEAVYLIDRATALAGLDRSEEAIADGERAATILPVDRDHLDGTVILQGLAKIYAKAGREDKAISILAELLSMPADITVRMLELSPEFDPLRSHLRFKELLEKYDKENEM
jgi:serine/threonine protein kinase/tetratricopeptide (TPR) repeat protein